MTTSRPLADRSRVFTVYDGQGPVPAALQGAVVALGNFDGLHRGHRAVIARAEELAGPQGRPAAILSFEPHPRSFFRPDQPVFRLTPAPVKLALAERFGLDGAFLLAFDAALASTPPIDFIEHLLAGHLGIAGLVIGHDFHFGKGRAGTPALVMETGLRLGLPVAIVEPQTDDGLLVSSSAVREALAAGDVETAARLLGYRWFVRGEVVHGDKRGRLLGYPTANILLAPDCRLAHGIYAVRLAVDGVVRDGVASFGRRPTFDDGAPRLEVFVFDFSGDLYGRTVDVEFCGFIRGEAKFDSVEALIAQMDRDSATARQMTARPTDCPAPSLLPI
jgi:riboflavin kinase/FMN adenylyltransferase